MKKRLLMIALCLVLTSTAFGCESSDNGKDKDRSSRTEKDVDDDEDDEDDHSDVLSAGDREIATSDVHYFIMKDGEVDYDELEKLFV